MRTAATATIDAAATGYATLGPWQHGSILQAVNLWGQDAVQPLTIRVALFDRPPTTSAEFDAGDQVTFPLTQPASTGFWTLGLMIGQRLLSRRYVAVEFAFLAPPGSAWSGGLNAGVQTPVVKRQTDQQLSDYAGRFVGVSDSSGGVQ